MDRYHYSKSKFFVATVYHPPDREYNEQDLIEFITPSKIIFKTEFKNNNC